MTGDEAAARAAGSVVTARCRMTHGGMALLELPGEGEPARWPAADVAAQAGIAVRDLPGAWLELTVRESPEEGRILSGFRVAERAEAATLDALGR